MEENKEKRIELKEGGRIKVDGKWEKGEGKEKDGENEEPIERELQSVE